MKNHEKPNESPEHEASESPEIEAMEQKTGKEMSGVKLKGGAHKSAKATEKAKPPIKKAAKVGPKITSTDGLVAFRKKKYGV